MCLSDLQAHEVVHGLRQEWLALDGPGILRGCQGGAVGEAGEHALQGGQEGMRVVQASGREEDLGVVGEAHGAHDEARLPREQVDSADDATENTSEVTTGCRGSSLQD